MSSTPETGAIHDIGYQRYDGARLGPAYIFRSLVVHSLKGAFGLGRSAKSKVMPLLLLAVLTLPTVIIAGVAVLTDADELPVRYSSYVLNLQLIISVFVAAQAPQLVSRDLRYRMAGLYFSRPVTTTAYVQAKLLAMSGAVLALLAVPLLVLYAGSLLGQMPFWANTSGVARALAGAAVFAVVLAAISLTIAAFTPRRGLGVAAVVAVLVVLSGVGATVQGIADSQGENGLAGWAGLISPYTLVDGIQVFALGAQTSSIAAPPGTLGGVVFVLVALAIVCAAYALLLLRYRRVPV